MLELLAGTGRSHDRHRAVLTTASGHLHDRHCAFFCDRRQVQNELTCLGTHPRSRGEHAATSCSGPGTSDSPPLSRGAHLACGGARLRLGLTPALAGSTGPGSISPRPFWNHPRSRGEHKLAGRPLPNYRDSPSLSRGARFLCGRPGPCPGLTPALAGSTRPRCRPMPRSGTHPRSRGEHLGVVIAVARAADSLPLSRGARRRRSRRAGRVGLTPRSRGEHRLAGRGRRTKRDSPPLSRGARLLEQVQLRGVGLTPALAGSTRRWP